VSYGWLGWVVCFFRGHIWLGEESTTEMAFGAFHLARVRPLCIRCSGTHETRPEVSEWDEEMV
jgi:hypothetical protein